MSERRACQVLGQSRSTQRRQPQVPDDEPRLVRRMVELATQYGRYGYRRVTALLQREDWRVNHKRVERLWRLEGLKVPKRQPKRRRLWLNDGSCVRLRPGHRDHVWSYDFVLARTHDGRPVRMLTVIDEYSRECSNSLIRTFEHQKTKPAGAVIRRRARCGLRLDRVCAPRARLLNVAGKHCYNRPYVAKPEPAAGHGFDSGISPHQHGASGLSRTRLPKSQIEEGSPIAFRQRMRRFAHRAPRARASL